MIPATSPTKLLARFSGFQGTRKATRPIMATRILFSNPTKLYDAAVVFLQDFLPVQAKGLCQEGQRSAISLQSPQRGIVTLPCPVLIGPKLPADAALKMQQVVCGRLTS